MKKKLLVFTLCFTLIFSSLNLKKSYADAGIISGPMLGTVVTLAVGSGIILNSSEDIINFGNMFYQKNKENWTELTEVFNSCVTIASNGVVTVGKEFINKAQEFFKILKVTMDGSLGSIDTIGDLTVGSNYKYSDFVTFNGDYHVFEGINIYVPSLGATRPFCIWAGGSNTYAYIHHGYIKDDGTRVQLSRTELGSVSSAMSSTLTFLNSSTDKIAPSDGLRYMLMRLSTARGSGTYDGWYSSSTINNIFTAQGSYSDTLINDNINNDGSIDVYVPGNLDSLVGVGSSDVIYNPSSNPPYDLPVGGVVTVPGVSNPSIDVNGDISFPSVDSPSVPSEGIWSTIKDFIIGLVVPNDSYWTDTWGGLYNNFTDSFPMVDMGGFDDLVTGEKKFPNIDINIMGVTGRVVNGDVVNSIVDWLRPIIAGFMMLCLMLFNYRKIYKLIRNTEPFGGIAPGTSDFSTGISEYSKQEVVKATDMVAEYRAWKERGGK